MLLDQTHRTWAFISAVILAVATVSYVVYAESTPKGPSGGSMMGLIYGVIGSAMMIFAGLLAGRRKVAHWRIGSAQFWLRGHLWLGTLSVPLILFHSGFGLGGTLEQLLWLFFAIVVVSGFFGLAMQHLMPRLLTSQIPRETFGAQVSYVRKRNRILSDELVSIHCGRISIESDSLGPALADLAGFAVDLKKREAEAGNKAEKDDVRLAKSRWNEQLDAENATLFLDLAKHAKSSGWVRTENDFPAHLLQIYDMPGIAMPEPPKAGKKEAAPSDAKPMSLLEQMRAKQQSSEKPTKPQSPLEMARTAGGAKRKKESPAKKKPSPAAAAVSGTKPTLLVVDDVEEEVAAVRKVLCDKYGYSAEIADDAASRTRKFVQTQAEADAGAETVAALESASEPESVPKPEAITRKKLSPLEQARAAGPAGAKKPASADKPLSPLEQARKAGAATRAGVATKSGADDKPKSPLELMKQKAATGVAGGKPKSSAKKPPVTPKKKSAAKRPILRTDELREFYLTTARPYLAGDGRSGRLADSTEASRAFTQMRATLPVELHETLGILQSRCDEHRQFAEQQRIHRWLHCWLALHIPFSMALFVLFAAHVIVSLRVVPWQFPFRF